MTIKKGSKHQNGIRLVTYKNVCCFKCVIVSFLQLMQWSEPSPASRAVPTAPAIFAKSFEWMGLRVEQQWENTTNCVAILENNSERKKKENLWNRKHINSHEHRIYLLWSLSFHARDVMFFCQTRSKKPQTLRFPSLYERAPDVANFWADWAIKCAVCKELLQFNLGRFSSESYYWHSFNCWWTFPAMFHGYVAESLETK